jgi:hypothetical protein
MITGCRVCEIAYLTQHPLYSSYWTRFLCNSLLVFMFILSIFIWLCKSIFPQRLSIIIKLLAKWLKINTLLQIVEGMRWWCQLPLLIFLICNWSNFLLFNITLWTIVLWMLYWKGWGKKWSWSALRQYHCSFLDGPRTNMKSVSQDSNLGTSEYEENANHVIALFGYF